MLASTYLSPPFLPFHHHTATTTTSAHLLSGDPNRRVRPRHMSGTATVHGISLRKQDILPPDTCDIYMHCKKVFVS
jgi:hypothetical protein